MRIVSITEFKNKMPALLKHITESGEAIFISGHGKIVAKLMLCDEWSAWDELSGSMKGSVLKYDAPTEPVEMYVD